MKSLLAVLFCLNVSLVAMPHSVVGQEANPRTILEFLKPGDHVGIARSSSTTVDSAKINKYSVQRFAITLDVRRISLSQLAAQYASVAAQIEVARTEFAASQVREPEKRSIAEISWIPDELPLNCTYVALGSTGQALTRNPLKQKRPITLTVWFDS